jgi:hypothetical protein
MRCSQTEYIKMTQKRATKKSAERQYQNILSDTRRAHINQLIDEQRSMNPRVEWCCVYVKEHLSKSRNPRRGDSETISMDVIITHRPFRSTYLRARMGDRVNSGLAFRPSLWAQHRDSPRMPGQNENLPPTVEGQSQPALSNHESVTPRREPEIDSPREVQPRASDCTDSTATIKVPSSPAFSAANSSDMGSEHSSGWSSEDSYPDSDSMCFDSSDESSGTDNPDELEPKHQVRTKSTLQPEASSPLRRVSSCGSQARTKSHSRSRGRIFDRNLIRGQVEAPSANFGPIRSESARSRGSVSGMRYHMQLMSDNEMRSRMLDHREASIGHREKRLKRTFYEAHQLELQPVNDSPPVCRCTCRCATERREVN